MSVRYQLRIAERVLGKSKHPPASQMSGTGYSGGYFSSRRHHRSSHNRPYNEYGTSYSDSRSGYSDWNDYDQTASQRGRYRRPSPDYNQYVVYDATSSVQEVLQDRSSPSPPSSSLPPSSQGPKSPSPPPAPPTPRSPSPTYLSTSLLPSEAVPLSDRLRKLLILDLNGTLLIRSQHQGGRAAYRWVNGQPPPPRTRPTHPRPYMSSFREFVFHPRTKEWLDVMVWSSAQPHSVDDMVGKCFGDRRSELKAIWARDTLGLSSDQYHKKTQTTKDLTKPWAHFASAPPKNTSPSPSSSRSASPEPASKSVPALPSSQSHSALTTLLLDDSPRKAHLQPYNHVCIKEYDAQLRRSDLELVECERARQQELEEKEAEDERAKQEALEEKEDEEASSGALSPDTSNDDQQSKKRKRKKKKKKNAVLLTENAEGRQYDQTLLAVIGILDEIKMQSNVAGWIRSGGLWCSRREEMQISTWEASPEPSGSASSSSVDVSDSHLDKRQKHRSVLRSETSKATATAGTEDLGQVQAGNDSVPAVDPSVSSADVVAAPTDSVDGETEAAAAKMWFEDDHTVHYWADRGRKALEILDIPVEPGIDC